MELHSLLGRVGDVELVVEVEEKTVDLGRGRTRTYEQRKVNFTKTKEAWLAWLDEAELVPARPAKLARYVGPYPLPAPEPIDDPSDPKWREDLELEKLKIGHFDLVFVVDSTGSMLPVMQWVARDMVKMLDVFKMVAREPRMGAVYYRHEVDPKAMASCCKRVAEGEGDDYAVKGFRLTSNVRYLAGKLAEEQAGSGHAGGAPYGGLMAAIEEQPWTRARSAKKVCVLIGDTRPTQGSMEPMKAYLEKATKRGFRVQVIKVRANLPGYDKIAKWGMGTSIYVDFHGMNRSGRGATGFPGIPGRRRPREPKGGWPQIVDPPASASPLKAVVAETIRTILPAQYHKRVDPLVALLLEYADVPESNNRRD
jgi:hypothetical protein